MDKQDRTRLGGGKPTERKESSGGSESVKQTPLEGQSEATANTSAAPARDRKRRTKTGCLTCRKRRIKCGEEKPRCNNCIKAKRDCQGYTQRVVFKNALGPFGAGYDPAVPANLQAPVTHFPHLPPQAQLHQLHQLQQLQLQLQQQGHPIAGQALNRQQRLLAPRLPYVSPALPLDYATQPIQQQHLHEQQPLQYSTIPLQTPSSQAEPIVASQPTHVPGDDFSSHVHTWSSADQLNYLPLPETTGTFQGSHHVAYQPQTTAEAIPPVYHNPDSHPVIVNDPAVQSMAETIGFYTDDTFQQAQVYYAWDAEQEALIPTIYAPEDLEDDYYDVDSDDEQQDVTEEEGYNQMNLIMASAHQDVMRSYNTYLNEPNILATYQPSMGSSPLNNPKTARIWVHFMHATAPAISIMERHNANPTPFFGGPVPAAQQGLWSYIMPLKSLEHPALLQSILAISSLHIARLQQSHFTITFKHYEYALRKVSKAVGLPVRRKQVATLAATLLLAFYEVTAADHTKWDRHVAGAAQLLKEIDFAGLTRDLRAYRRSVRSQKPAWAGSYDPFSSYSYAEDDPFAAKESQVDANVVSRLTGRPIDYDQIGRVDVYAKAKRRHFSRKDIENFRLQCDLYWWYAKHDMYQSMLSGNRLLNPIERWDAVPPRAGLGKADAIYGSWDHLVLLMARMMDFGYRDRKRKIQSLQSSGGEWRPHPGFFKFVGRFAPKTQGGGPRGPGGPPPGMGPPPGRPQGPPGGSNPPPQSQSSTQPPMYGMAPTGGPVPAPAAFTTMGESPPYSGFVDEDEDTTLEEAEAEWERILGAYEFYESQLGEGFAPLPPDTTTPVSSPFGPAIQFRSHTIAVLWAYYYVGRIILNRLHPSMPPAAMVAASTAASTTARFAQTIGRIAAGIYYPQLYVQEVGNLNPNLGGAWIQATVTLFVAGIQYIDQTQRDWTVSTLRGTSRVTGWQSAEAIAAGCEAAWIRTAAVGRGPPYVRGPEFSEKENPVYTRRGVRGDEQVAPDSNYERRFVKVEKRLRGSYAMGLLELESDLDGLNLDP